MISLTSSEKGSLKAILKRGGIDRKYRVVVFGSRALGTAKKYSDVDLALIGSSPVPAKLKALLAEAFEASDLPYTVDIVDFNQASPALQSQITEHGQELLVTA
jgi:predicted nucleotidyltransferase